MLGLFGGDKAAAATATAAPQRRTMEAIQQQTQTSPEPASPQQLA